MRPPPGTVLPNDPFLGPKHCNARAIQETAESTSTTQNASEARFGLPDVTRPLAKTTSSSSRVVYSLLASDATVRENDVFWALYGQLPELIARARDEDGQPNFEHHKVIRLLAHGADSFTRT